MTQSEVVADEATASYLSRIEDGQRRPDLGLLARMAQRMGTTLEALLIDMAPERSGEFELALDHAELALVSGDGRAALEQTDSLLSRLSLPRDAALRRRALQVHAGALEALGDLTNAITELEELAADPVPDAAWLRGLIALSRCYRDSGDFSKAIAVGSRTQGIIEDLGIAGLTEAIQLTVTVAAAYHRLGDMGEAMRTCVRALEAAERYDSPIAKASAYWNASTIETSTRGATPVAIDMAKKALALFELGQDNRNLAKLRAEIATMHLAAEPPEPEAALAVLAKAQTELEWSGGSAWDRALVHITRARALMLLGDMDSAGDEVQRGRGLAPDTAPFLRATACAIEGQVAFTEGRIDDAKNLYQQAVHLLTAAGSDRDAAELWFELAHLLTDVGDTEAALSAFKSAGASSGFRVRLPSREQASS